MKTGVGLWIMANRWSEKKVEEKECNLKKENDSPSVLIVFVNRQIVSENGVRFTYLFFLLSRKTFPQTGIIPRLCQNRVGPCYKRRTRSHWVSEILWASAGHQDRREHAHGTIRGIPYYSLRPANNELTIRFQTWHAFLSSKACKIRSVLTLFHNHDWGVPTLLLNTTRYSKTQSTPEKNGYSWVIVRDSVSGID